MQRNLESIEILEELLTSVKLRGYRRTLTLLKVNNYDKYKVTNNFDKFVIKTVSEAFKMNEDELMFGRYTRGDTKYAIGFCVYYLYENKSLGEIRKQIFKFKNITLLSKYRQLIFDLRHKNVMDKKYIAIKEDFDRKIENFKKENK